MELFRCCAYDLTTILVIIYFKRELLLLTLGILAIFLLFLCLRITFEENVQIVFDRLGLLSSVATLNKFFVNLHSCLFNTCFHLTNLFVLGS